MSFVDFVVLPPGHGRSVTDFWGWDAHEAQLRCPDGVWVVIEEDVVPGGALTFWRRNYFFLILAHLYIKCEYRNQTS